jgi:hypothetical protein
MAPIDEKEFLEAQRVFIRVIASNLIEIQALTAMSLSGGTGGASLQAARHAAQQAYQPLLDALDHADDRPLLEMLLRLRHPVQ